MAPPSTAVLWSTKSTASGRHFLPPTTYSESTSSPVETQSIPAVTVLQSTSSASSVAEGGGACAAVNTECAVPAMSPGDREELDRINRRDSKEINEQFSVLRDETQEYLDRIGCDVSRVVTCVMDVRVVKGDEKKMLWNRLELVTTVGRVFVELIKMNLLTYIQFSIVEHIIKVLCKDYEPLQKGLEKYKDNFRHYIMRRVCDSSLFQHGRFEVLTPEKAKGVTDVFIITDDKWDESTKFKYILELKDIVAQALNITNFNVKLLTITSPQCLKLHLTIPVEISMSVFPLTLEEWNKLSSLGIVEISCLTFTYKIGKF